MQLGRSPVSLMDLIRAGLIQPGQTIRFARRGRDIQAEITARGTILLNRTEYKSPSAAASSITHNAVNGWEAWRTEMEDLGWVRIAYLRDMVKTSKNRVKSKMSTGPAKL